MENFESHPVGFFFPLFEDISFSVTPMELHPRFTLRMFENKSISEKYEYSKDSIANYGWQLFEKLTLINTFEYHYLMTYHIEHIENKREWLNSYLHLITGNRDLFVERCGIEKYTFLFKMVIDHYSAFNNAFLSPLSNSCEECRSRITTNIKRDVYLLDNLDGPEREYFHAALKMDYRRFATFWNFKIDSLDLDDLKDKNQMIDIENLFKEHLKEEYAKKGLNGFEGLKPIVANCTTTDCVKYFADFLNTTTDEDGEYVFDYNNSTASGWMPHLFDCKKSKKIKASSYRDKFPSPEKNRGNRPKGGSKR